jgi:hypothetical protein
LKKIVTEISIKSKLNILGRLGQAFDTARKPLMDE